MHAAYNFYFTVSLKHTVIRQNSTEFRHFLHFSASRVHSQTQDCMYRSMDLCHYLSDSQKPEVRTRSNRIIVPPDCRPGVEASVFHIDSFKSPDDGIEKDGRQSFAVKSYLETKYRKNQKTNNHTQKFMIDYGREFDSHYHLNTTQPVTVQAVIPNSSALNYYISFHWKCLQSFLQAVLLVMSVSDFL